MTMMTFYNNYLLVIFASSLLVGFCQCLDDYCGDVGKADTLQMTIMLFRDGDRTPLGTYPTDPYQEDTWKKHGGWGRLTQIGMQQHYNFGKWSRKCYGAFLTDTYNPKEIYVRSTTADRATMSAQSHVAGLLTPKDFQVWSSTDDLAKYWQPVPIVTMGRENMKDYVVEEMLLPPDGYCQRYDIMLTTSWINNDSNSWQQIQHDNQQLLDYIGENAGLSVPGSLFEVAFLVADTVYVEKIKGLKLPDWINSTVEQKMIDWKDLFLLSHVADDDIVRLGVGTLITNLGQLFQKKAENQVAYKHVIYSAHDSTVAGLLRAYDPNFKINVPYAAGLITELHLNQSMANRYYVKAFYRPDPTATPTPVKVRNCGEPCWLDKFIQNLQPLAINERKRLCRDTSTLKPPTWHNSTNRPAHRPHPPKHPVNKPPSSPGRPHNSTSTLLKHTPIIIPICFIVNNVMMAF